MAMDIWKGWPNGAALEDNAPPKSGEAIVAGMFVKKDSNGELIKADGTAGELAVFALHDQSSPDVEFANSLPYILGNALVLTDQFVAANYTQGQRLEVGSAGNAGKVQAFSSGQGVGYFDGFESRDGNNLMRIYISRA